jgi:selenocysteine-specific elongation factor
MKSIVNINCGVLGHIDSGKTALCRALHQVASTASMDKHPQSKERGITLDLGFSTFTIDPSKQDNPPLGVTLVDCPGHASLIRTVIGGSQIMDLCVLVLDVQKGFQAQTAECLIIAEVITATLIIVVNKIDLINPEVRVDYLSGFESKVRRALSKTWFGENVPICFVSASQHEGLDGLVRTIDATITYPPKRSDKGPLHVAFDHCFSVKGQGTVFTGTVLSGAVSKGDKVYIPDTGEIGEVRSMQAFRKPTERAIQGDRVGICVPGIPPGDKERGDIYSPTNGSLCRGTIMVFLVRKVRYFKASLQNVTVEIDVGHQHAMAQLIFFEPHRGTSSLREGDVGEHLCGVGLLGRGPLLGDIDRDMLKFQKILNSKDAEFKLVSDIDNRNSESESFLCMMLFDRKLTLLPNSVVIGARLDVEQDGSGSRIALYGRHLEADIGILRSNIRKTKEKVGVITREQDSVTYLVNGLLKKGVGDASKLIGKDIIHGKTNTKGRIDSTFGKSGLLKVCFDDPIGDAKDDEVKLTIEKPALSKIIDSHVRLNQNR